MQRRCMAFGVAVLLLAVAGCQPLSDEEPFLPNNDSTTPLQGVWISYLELREALTGATPDQAAQRLDAMLDTCSQHKLNAVFFHVRAHSDAYYPSAVFPAAAAAEGLLAQGFDPLAYTLEAAHQRGLAFHAWINPYRIGEQPAQTGDCFEKNGVWYYDPAADSARQRVLDGVREILTTYPVDGIHFDDYFYPAGMVETGEPFEHIPAGTDVTLWRQTHVDSLVSGVYSLCKSHKIVFGISPMANIEACRTIAFADVTRWMTQPGYIDYICPQIYTGFTHETNPFDKVLAQWTDLPRRPQVKLYIGLALYKAGMDEDPYAGSGSKEWGQHSDMISRQVTALRGQADGFVLFRQTHLTDPLAADEMASLQPLL